ncbi:MAG TPA: hypothetical protein VK841_04915 [Polyangiaceae bacterium]|nr:hypothetical protein [Polyangiaceae bacterium]
MVRAPAWALLARVLAGASFSLASSTALALAVFSLASCRGSPGSAESPDAATSPQAKAEPAPLVSPLSPPALAGASPAASEGAPPPEGARAAPVSMPIDRAVPVDVIHEPPLAREAAGKELVSKEPGVGAKETAREARGLAGYSLQVVLRAGEGPAAPRASEVNAAAIEAAKRRTETRMTVDFTPSRARFVLASGFVVPPGTELRARADRYGHLLFWPGEKTYRVVQPGTLRALLGERRLDVAPVGAADVHPGGDGRRLNFHTRHVEVATRAAKASLELASIREAGDGGALLCRLLLDLMNASPAASPCGSDDVPLHAELRWATRGTLVLDVTSIAREVDLTAQDMAAPPAGYDLADAPPADQASETLIPRSDLQAFRTAPIDAPPAAARDARAPAPDAGLLLINSSDELRVAWVDGVPVAWVAPGERLALTSMLRGRYAVQWRTFLGDSWDSPDTVIVPGTSEVGSAR